MHDKITELRKVGKLNEAYNLAIQEYKKDKDNFYIKSAFSWVLYNLIKNSSDFNSILKYSNEFLELDIEQGGEIDIYGMISGVFSKFIKNNFKTLEDQFNFIQKKYEQNGNNIFLKNPYSWNLYNIIKEKLEKKDLKGLEGYINILNHLDIDHGGEFDIYEMLAGQFYKTLKDTTDIDKYKLLLFHYSKLKNYKPTKTHSFILFDVINKYKKNDNYFDSKFDFYGFIKLWGIDNFQLEDYEEGEYKGKTTQSTFEKAVSILGGKIKSANNITDLGDISDLESILEKGINKELKWAGYYLGKLKLLNGDYKEAEAFILKVVKKEKTQFWSWYLLGEVLLKQGHNDLYFSALSKALSCGNDDNFLNNLREEYIQKLLENNLFNEANIELNHIIQNKIENDFKITESLSKLSENSWYIKNTSGNNKSFYNKNIKIIEEYLYSDIDDTIIYIDYVNKDKHILNFKDKNRKKGFFNFKNLKGVKVVKGDVIKAKIEKIDNEYYNVYKIYDEKYEILDFFDYIPDELIYIDFINKEKSIINFTNRGKRKGFFNFGNFNIDGLKRGDIINVKVENDKGEHYKIYKLESKTYTLLDMFNYDNILIEYINFDKKILNFVGSYIHGFFNFNGYEDTIKETNSGDFLEVILGSHDGEYYNILDCKKSTILDDPYLKKEFDGSINIRNGNGFGFVDDMFVGTDLLKGIDDGDDVSGIAIKSYNKKKFEISRKVINIKKNS